VEHVFYHFSNGRAAIQNVNLYEQGGKLIGIMGASGSGKSTLLGVLNGSEKPSSGRVLINDVNVHEEAGKVEGIIGYVPQDDLLLEDLTVYQNLYYAARLCFGSHSDEQIRRTVDKVIVSLGLLEIKDLKVGSPLHKAISGGQRKRLNIGLELLREPTVLFVDEPTSGLSSRDSENIMDLLKELALRGKMVFVVIHQPSSDIFKMFDSLLILDVGGFQIYYGHPIEAVNYFRDIVNAANKSQGACPECGNINPEQIFNIIETRIVNEYGRLTQTRKISPGQWYQYFKQKIKLPRIRHVKDPLPVVQKIPNWFKQFKVFVVRDILSKLANRQYFWINLLEAPLLAFFIAYMVKYHNILSRPDSEYSFYENENIPVYFFMSVVVSIFFGLTMSAEEIFRDQRILKRERFLHLSRSSYLVSKVLVMFLISAIQTFSFVLVGNLVLEIPVTELRYWFILFSSSCFANLLGLNISSGFTSAVTIYILIPVLVIPQMLLSGVVINFDKFNPKVGKPVGVPMVGELMASRWAFEAYMVTQFRDNPFERIFYDKDKRIAMSEYKRVYYIPELESKLAYCLNNRSHWRDRNHEGMVSSLRLLQNEIRSELRLVGEEHLPEVNDLEVMRFDSVTYDSTERFLTILKQFYTNRMNRVSAEKQAMIDSMTRTPEDLAAYEQFRSRYVNKAVESAVKNTTTPLRIVEFDGRLVQRVYPIYEDEHKPRHSLDFSANLYQPTKHILGFVVDTLVFNLLVIWIFTLGLFLTLYFDLLQRIMLSFERRKKQRRAALT
jgi:ABC-type multidrug transport system ATPase subunit